MRCPTRCPTRCPDPVHVPCVHHTHLCRSVQVPAAPRAFPSCFISPSSSPTPRCRNAPMLPPRAYPCLTRPASSASPPADLPAPAMPPAMANPFGPHSPIRRPICSLAESQSPCWTPTYPAGRFCVCSSCSSINSSSSRVQYSATRWPTPCLA